MSLVFRRHILHQHPELHHCALVAYDADVLPTLPSTSITTGRQHSSPVPYGADILPSSSSTLTTKGQAPHLPSHLHSRWLPGTFTDIDATRSGSSPHWSSTSPTTFGVFSASTTQEKSTMPLRSSTQLMASWRLHRHQHVKSGVSPPRSSSPPMAFRRDILHQQWGQQCTPLLITVDGVLA